jgi:hypothetical protein
MVDKKIKLCITGAFTVVVLLLGILFIRDTNYSESGGLSYEEKKKDAEYLVHILEEVYPFYEKERKQKNIESKSKIIKSISKTKTDEEFFNAILNTLEGIDKGQVNASPNSLNERDLVLLDEKWGIEKENILIKSYEGQKKWHEFFNKRYKINEYTAPEVYTEYFEGDYYIRGTKNPNVYTGDKIVKIQGIDIDEYVGKHLNNKFHSSYFKYYDSKKNKEVVLGDLFQLKDKNSKVKISVIGKDGIEKEVDIGVDDPNKPIIYIENMVEHQYYMDNRKGLLNVYEQGKVVALNFSMEEPNYTEEAKDNIYKAIANSEYLILDVRNFSAGLLFHEIFEYICAGNLEINRYTIMKKNQYNDQVMDYIENQYAAIFNEKYDFNNSSIDEKYPPDQYYRLKEEEIKLKGLGKYKGQVFIFSDVQDYTPISPHILTMVNFDDKISIIANNNMKIYGEYYLGFKPQAILPNSNIVISIQNSFQVDDEGNLLMENYFKPNYIIDKDKELYIAALRGEINPLYYDNFRKYTDEDEYYRKFLEITSK